jgi:hypothetical protein
MALSHAQSTPATFWKDEGLGVHDIKSALLGRASEVLSWWSQGGGGGGGEDGGEVAPSCSNPDNQPKELVNHHNLPHVREFGGVRAVGPMLPLPPSFFEPFPFELEDEPVFDPAIHLDLVKPSEVALLHDFTLHPREVRPTAVPNNNNSDPMGTGGGSGGVGSPLAFTAPFKIFSDQGLMALRSIVEREKYHAYVNHRSMELRGLYYRSPFVRTLVNCPELLDFLARLIGEPVLPHMLLMNAVVVNIGAVGDAAAAQAEAIQGVVDPWHLDSVAYVAVALISDIKGMVGGKLQLVKMSKELALKEIEGTLNNVTGHDLLSVSYEQAGHCILVQGSEVFHRVTRVKSAKEPRLSFVMSFQPANPFQPDKTSLDTFERFDEGSSLNTGGGGSTAYEFYRLKAQTMGSALHALAALDPPTRDGPALAGRLRAIGAELERTAALLNRTTSDFVGFVNETHLAQLAAVNEDSA